MKTRHGFVSNSSSSSFVVRGIRAKTLYFCSAITEDNYEEKLDVVDGKLRINKSKLKVFSTRDYFGGEGRDDLIVGMKLESPEDGVATEYKDDPNRDEEIKTELSKLGFKQEDINHLSYFFQYISNDNY